MDAQTRDGNGLVDRASKLLERQLSERIVRVDRSHGSLSSFLRVRMSFSTHSTLEFKREWNE